MPKPQVRWSPDSQKVAISRPLRTWIYNLDNGRTKCLKTWRRAERCPVVWSPDSRSIYYVRHIVMGMFGLEVVKVTLRE